MIMAEEENKKDEKDSAEERVARVRQLLQDRSEDAAKTVKTWLQQEE
jgi:flagellar biosynthesis/type III secretory pathway M-ring protein FliF/YscJ|tara:strand:+ start:1547 stop:1687 length:141 start_codon:yes stop_codon:yes gene_type:complete